MGRMLEISTKAGADAFIVQKFSGREALGRLSEYELELLSDRPDLGAELLLGSNATVALELGDGQSARYFNGYITRFTVQGAVRTSAYKGNAGYAYRATLSPGLWFLTRASNCRIFSALSIGDLIVQCLGESGLMDVDSRIGATEVRDFIVQYRETNFNFISRLAEHAGIYYYFIHDNGSHKIVLVDAAGSHRMIPDLPSIGFIGPGRQDATLTELALVARVRSGAFATGDYNYVTPNTQIAAVSARPRPHDNAGFEAFDFPASTTTAAFAHAYATIRAEELGCGYQVAYGGGTERNIQVGFKTRVKNHGIGALNQDYLVVAHTFSATNNGAQSSGPGASFRCSFEAIPAGVQFRPARTAQRPTIAGTQTARVVADFRADTGCAGVDDTSGANLARVKIEFCWDRYRKPSCWARVSQPWAGKGYGFQNMPRVGEEVLVQFIDGDPDRPVVVGRVYNAENMPPFKLPAHASVTGIKTLSMDSGGAGVAGAWNELRFDDLSGAEQIYVQAQKDFDLRVLNDSKTWVGGQSHHVVQADAFHEFDADHHVQTTGDHNDKVGGSLSWDVGADVHLKSGSGILHDAARELHLKAGTKVVIEAGVQLSLKVGASFVDINAGGVFINGAIVGVNSGGSAGAGTGASPIAPKAARVAMTSAGASPPVQPPSLARPAAFSTQADSFKVAARVGTPFVASCDAR